MALESSTKSMGTVLRSQMIQINALNLDSANPEAVTRTLSAKADAQNADRLIMELQEIERIKTKAEEERTPAEQDWLILKKAVEELSSEEMKKKTAIVAEQKKSLIKAKTAGESMTAKDFLDFLKIQKEAQMKVNDLFMNKKIGAEQKSFEEKIWEGYPADFDPATYEKDEWIDYSGEGKIGRHVNCDGMTTYT